MNEVTLLNCQGLIENRDRVREVYPWAGGLVQLCCAGVYSTHGLIADAQRLEFCKTLLEERVGAFSSFRGAARAPIAAMLSLSDEPENALGRALAVYDRLRQDFHSSAYLPLAALALAQLAPQGAEEALCQRTRALYCEMKRDHPFLTSSEDCAFCALLALSEKPDELLLGDMETCYGLLRGEFFSGNGVQSLSHALALGDCPPEVACGRTMELYHRLRDGGRRFGTSYELPTLGLLALAWAELAEIAADILEIDAWLARQPGFGLLGGVSAKQRLLYAGALAVRYYLAPEALDAAASSATLGLVIAQEMAACAAVAASSAAASSAS